VSDVRVVAAILVKANARGANPGAIRRQTIRSILPAFSRDRSVGQHPHPSLLPQESRIFACALHADRWEQHRKCRREDQPSGTLL